jgi:hypothetical protein
MLTTEQERDLKLFLALVRHRASLHLEDFPDLADEVAEFGLQGRQADERNRAVALYYHRVRMAAVQKESSIRES